MSFTARLKKLASETEQNQKDAAQASREKQVQIAAKIRKASSVLADELNANRRVFGKPKALTVESDGVMLLSVGEFTPARRGVSGVFR